MEFTPVNTEARKKLGIKAGDTVRVMQKIEEKGKTRLQPFEGIILGVKHGTEPGATFTVRRMTGGFGVEKIFPLFSPNIDSIEILKRSKVRRSKLYHIRETALKQIKKRMKMMFVSIKEEKEEPKKEEESSEEESKSNETNDAVKENESAEVKEEKIEEAKQEESKNEEGDSQKDEKPAEEEKTEDSDNSEDKK